MKIAIMQPTYLPWTGYFGLIDYVDKFILLDDVQFSYQSWQHRNKILTKSGTIWLTVPCGKSNNKKLLNEVEIKNNFFLKKHIKSINQNYEKTFFFKNFSNQLFEVMNKKNEYLSELNINLILMIKDYLQIKTKILKSSELRINKSPKDQYIFDICQSLNATEYVSPPGAEDYLKDSNLFFKNNLPIEYFAYNHPIYKQTKEDFVSHISVIDLIFNNGKKSLEIIRSGF
ncbi:WbqC family protein [Candidatus Pelagibacter sp.]|nr:WbqC family protein [Candidatus Pelagibacter sp.]